MDPETSARFLDFAAGDENPELRRELERVGLTRSNPEVPILRRPMILPGCHAMAVKTILAARQMLFFRRFGSTLRWAMMHQPRPVLRDADVLGAFCRAESFLPSRLGDLDCLPRALALFAFLRHASRRPVFVIGVKRFPFTAHAWVELGGKPVLENEQDESRISAFRPILRVA
ncbi:lasso peptide biosynthesis B2 protein [Sagittula salina]|uniref:Lasso peptide biosynthesis B2 protein n=1 Tax=Sagittula salina TaxID=2820268 RepID=A0A940MKT9_9RHOB|nr:lasso peptide biosynthesis B2 protein [Sagittula salina]MBP0483655.1 lasso peptide biosynthesis B2 protein [Sagittula salina]